MADRNPFRKVTAAYDPSASPLERCLDELVACLREHNYALTVDQGLMVIGKIGPDQRFYVEAVLSLITGHAADWKPVSVKSKELPT